MLFNTTEETWETPPQNKQENNNLQALFRRNKLPTQKNNSLEEFSTQNGPPKENNKIIVKIIK